MKVARPVRTSFDESAELFKRLQDEILDKLKVRVEERGWFFSHRLKELESFAQKVETGRVADPGRMEDYFACTIVVPTSPQVAEAEQLVTSLYDLRVRRPQSDDETHKASSSFDFDDLRLYVARRESEIGRNGDLTGLVFEVQIKTMLQYAWGVATHDLVYKSKSVNWALERIAFQVKAMLEHAEVTIAEAVAMSASPALNKTDRRTRELQAVIGHLEDFWPKDRLPDDLKRLAENISGLLRACDAGAETLIVIWEEERERLGTLPTDLSPYAFTVQALSQNAAAQFENRFKRNHVKTKIAIHADMDIPESLRANHPRVVNLA